MSGKLLGNRYWNCGNIGVAAVAVEGAIGDWAAYIGGSKSTWSEQDAIEEAKAHGCKLSVNVALTLFPGIDKPYRH